MTVSKLEVRDLEVFAEKIRYYTLKTLNNLGFGHYGGSLSIVEVLAVLYEREMNVSPENFNDYDRDHFVLSKGHAGPALYATLMLKGFFDEDMLMTLNQNGTRLPSHPDRNLTPGVDMTTGSLGQGISAASGISYAKKIKGLDGYTYCIVGDGELNEGQCWEAVQFAAHNNLENFIVFVDNNKKQLDGTTEEICRPYSFKEKFISFGFDAVEVNGHNIQEIIEAIEHAKAKANNKPTCIVLDTLKGNGVQLVSDMKANHHLRLDSEMLEELKAVEKDLESKIKELETND